MKAVYLSGPITGLNYKGARCGWRKDFRDMLEPGITVLSPMRHEGHLAELRGPMSVRALRKFETEKNHIFSHPKMIVTKDRLDIKQSSIMVVNLQGATKVSQGTIYEIGYADALGKTIIVVTDEGNVHNSPFITEAAAQVVDTLEDAAQIVNSLLSEGI